MINSLKLIRNIGQFDSATTSALMSNVTLIYAENGRGKTTIAAILRSLSTGEALPILERRRLGASNPPKVVISNTDGSSAGAMFIDGAWNTTLPQIVIFDDEFVDQNVYSGLAVEADHRRHLHELILGTEGGILGRELQELVTQIEAHNTTLRSLAAPLTDAVRSGIPIDEFCRLSRPADINEALEDAERLLAAASQENEIRAAELLPQYFCPP